MPPLGPKLPHKPPARIEQQRINNNLNTPPLQFLRRIPHLQRQKDAADIEGKGISFIRGVIRHLAFEPAEAIGVEFFENRGGDLRGDQDAVVFAVFDVPTESGGRADGSWVWRCALEEEIFWWASWWREYVDG